MEKKNEHSQYKCVLGIVLEIAAALWGWYYPNIV